MEEQGDFVDGIHVVDANNLFKVYLAARGNLAGRGFVDGQITAAGNL